MNYVAMLCPLPDPVPPLNHSNDGDGEDEGEDDGDSSWDTVHQRMRHYDRFQGDPTTHRLDNPLRGLFPVWVDGDHDDDVQERLVSFFDPPLRKCMLEVWVHPDLCRMRRLSELALIAHQLRKVCRECSVGGEIADGIQGKMVKWYPRVRQLGYHF